MSRVVLACTICGEPWVVTHSQIGAIAIRPDSWFSPTMNTWSAHCICRHYSAPTEGDLYCLLGYTYA